MINFLKGMPELNYCREIDITGEIDQQCYQKFLVEFKNVIERDAQVLAWTNKFRKVFNTDVNPIQMPPVRININSGGGSIEACNAIVDLLDESQIAIQMHALGMCMSAAFTIYLHGEVRSAGKSAKFMVHKGRGGAFGSVPECKADVDYFELLEKDALDIVTKVTKMTEEDIQKCKIANRYIAYEEAVDLDIINNDNYYGLGSLDKEDEEYEEIEDDKGVEEELSEEVLQGLEELENVGTVPAEYLPSLQDFTEKTQSSKFKKFIRRFIK